MTARWAYAALFVPLSAMAADKIKWEDVRIVKSEDALPAGCEWVTTVETGFWSSTFTMTGALKKVRQRAAKAGANYLVIVDASGGQQGAVTGNLGIGTTAYVALGEAYTCPPREQPP